jgi:hypothetical protein
MKALGPGGGDANGFRDGSAWVRNDSSIALTCQLGRKPFRLLTGEASQILDERVQVLLFAQLKREPAERDA